MTTYEIEIFTIYNAIHLQTDAIDDEVKEILSQPYVIKYTIRDVETSSYGVLKKQMHK